MRLATDFSPPRGSLLNPNRRSDCNRVGNSHFRSSLFRSKLLSLKSESLFKKEWHEWFTHFLRANRTFALKKQVICPPKFVVFAMFFLQFFTAFPICMPKSESLPSLFAPSLFFKEYFALLHTKIKWYAQKTKERIPNPGFKTAVGILAVEQRILSVSLAAHFWSCGRRTSPGYCTGWHPLSWQAVKAGNHSYRPQISRAGRIIILAAEEKRSPALHYTKLLLSVTVNALPAENLKLTMLYEI